MTDAREEFHRHAVLMLREAEQAETAIRRRLGELTGTVRCTAVVATMQFAMRNRGGLSRQLPKVKAHECRTAPAQ